MSFDPINNPIDHITLAGRRSPGIATITGADIERILTERKGYGFGGAYVVYRGIKPAHFTVIFEIGPDDWPEWHTFRDLLSRAPLGRRARSLDIWHPILEDAGIRQVLVEKTGQPVQDPSNGAWTVSVMFAEYRRPRRALSTPEGSESETLTPGERDIQARESRIRASRAQRDALAADL